MIEAQALNREGPVLRTPLASMDKIFEQEFMKGEAAGMRAILALPQTIVDDVQSRIDEIVQPEGEGHAESP